jgi:hypothetical protein
MHESSLDCVSFRFDHPKLLEIVIERLYVHGSTCAPMCARRRARRPGARTPGDEQRDWAQERPATSKVTGRKDARRRAKRPGSRTPGDEQGVRTQGRPTKAALRRQAPGVSFFPQHPRGGYFSPRDENRGFSFSHLHDKGVIFPTYTTRGLFFPKANRRGVSGLQAPKSKVQTPKFVVVGSGRHPAEMEPH